MAIIYTYPNGPSPLTGEELIVISDVNNSNATRNITTQAIADLADFTITFGDANGTGLIYSPNTLTSPGGTVDLTGTLVIGHGGTGGTTQQEAVDNVTNASSGGAGQVLTTDGTNASWQTIPTPPIEDLATTLVAGNTTGGTDIEMTTSDDIVATASDPGKTVHVDFGVLPTARRVQITTDNKGFLTPWMTIDNSSFSLNYGSTSSLVVNNNSIDVEAGFFRVKNTNYGRFAPAPLTADRVYTFQDKTGVVPVGPAWNTSIANPTAGEDGYVITWDDTAGEYQLLAAGAGSNGIYSGSGSLPVAANVATMASGSSLKFSAAGDSNLLNIAAVSGNSTIGIGGINANRKLEITTNDATHYYGLYVENNQATSISFGFGIGAEVNSANNFNTGLVSSVAGGLIESKALDAVASGTTKNIAGRFSATSGTTNYAIIADNGQSGFGTTTPDPSAIVDVSSTTQGFLPPRMTSAQMQAISSPAEGLIVHADDADRPHYNNGTSWRGFGDLYGLYSQTVQSATVTNTAVETSIVGTGVGTLSVPPNGFKVGDSFHAKIGGVISAQNGDQIEIKIKTGATVLATTGAISLEPVTALGWECELDFTIATLGAAGSICTNGNFAYNRNTGSLEGFVFQDVQPIDTTVANTLDITVTWGQIKTQDQIYSANFVLHRTFVGS